MSKKSDEIVYGPYFEKMKEILYEGFFRNDVGDVEKSLSCLFFELFQEIFVMEELSESGYTVRLLNYKIWWNNERESIDAFIVMPYYKFNLHSYLEEMKKRDSVNISSIISLMIQCCDCVLACHCRGIIHNDLKLNNFLCNSDGKVYLGDFGSITRKTCRDENYMEEYIKTRYLVLTKEFTAPETVLYGKCNDKTDVYSLGLMFTEVYDFCIGQISSNIVNSNIALKIKEIIASMTQTKTKKRIDSIEEVKKYLQNLV